MLFLRKNTYQAARTQAQVEVFCSTHPYQAFDNWPGYCCQKWRIRIFESKNNAVPIRTPNRCIGKVVGNFIRGNGSTVIKESVLAEIKHILLAIVLDFPGCRDPRLNAAIGSNNS